MDTWKAKTASESSDGDREVEEEEKGCSGEEEEEQFLHSLPREKRWGTQYLHFFQQFWCLPPNLKPTISFQKHFQAKHNDIIIASLPKSGTTWLKALAFATAKRNGFTPSQTNHPLLHSNPHTLVPHFEFDIFGDNPKSSDIVDLSTLPDPRMFGTHVPFPSLSHSILTSNCKIIYVCRNPFDAFISLWHFSNNIMSSRSLPGTTLEDAFEMYCDGQHPFGPFWSHLLGYWKASKDTPNKVLFLKYEDLKANTHLELKKVAKFLDCPFTQEEERGGVIDSIIELCSFNKMKELDVNKSTKETSLTVENKSTKETSLTVENKHFFRKGEIGDWMNYFSPWMTEKFSKVIEEKLTGSGLSF